MTGLFVQRCPMKHMVQSVQLRSIQSMRVVKADSTIHKSGNLVPATFELGSLDSKSRVLAIATWNPAQIIRLALINVEQKETGTIMLEKGVFSN